MLTNATVHTIVTPSPEPTGVYISPLFRTPNRWVEVSEVNREARGLCLRHEAWGCGGRMSMLPPGSNGHASRLRRSVGASGGERLMLMSPQADALMVFRRSVSRFDSLLDGVQVTVFRNEGHFRSCSLIREAVDEWASVKWPGVRLFVLVPGKRIVASNPGYPFRVAGWRRGGFTAGGVIVLSRPL